VGDDDGDGDNDSGESTCGDHSGCGCRVINGVYDLGRIVAGRKNVCSPS
jgi:hypothetical protein